ncbi:uncharacterized protein LOC110447600 [Mizuhopecten yessoensis]|uniref:Uncharacterized protein n=1 Tax=Mizuhopecten yessoensis TaxID=6573 RepID=A0A210QV09_MIZYE|nr:uncharacterized protein LOC110447600 [Mizuhopecten yessoensis]OWF52565.1 hypothetical protein KP79_PYT18848 [Mizuhopecten yessoensis]
MCEMNDKCNGPDVYSNCSCDPNRPQTQIETTAMSPRPTLPPWCFSPDGQTCSWYRECLEERYHCEGTDAAYAISYAEKFCDLYSNHYRSFSVDGQQWIDAVRKCLQVGLVPVLRPWVSATCSEIKNRAFASHTNCYTGPSSGISFCSLSLGDRWKVFWTIKSAFIGSFVETLKGIWDTMYKCLRYNSNPVSVGNNNVEVTHIFVKKQDFMERNPDEFAGKAIDYIAVNEKWDLKAMTWFSYSGLPNNDTGRLSDFRIDVILASKRAFDLNAPNAIDVNTTETVMSFANSVRNGQIRLTVDGARVDVLSMEACADIECSRTFIEVVAPVNTGTRPKISGIFVLIVGVLSFVYRKF